MGICKKCNKDKKFRINGVCRSCEELEDCNCEGFYKTEYFLALKKLQKLREEICELRKATKIIVKEPFKPCGKEFEFMEADEVYKAMCGGEDGLCDTCAVQIASEVVD